MGENKYMDLLYGKKCSKMVKMYENFKFSNSNFENGCVLHVLSQIRGAENDFGIIFPDSTWPWLENTSQWQSHNTREARREDSVSQWYSYKILEKNIFR